MTCEELIAFHLIKKYQIGGLLRGKIYEKSLFNFSASSLKS